MSMHLREIIVLMIGLTFSGFVRCQMTLDTLVANNHKNVALFFPNPIRQAIVGSEDFVFSYNREEEGYFGLLQSVAGKDSDLLVVTSDGNVYAFILKYGEELSRLRYFIREEDRIGKERPAVKSLKKRPKNDVASYENSCKMLLHNDYRAIATERSRGVRLRLENMVYAGKEVYMVFEIQNRSEIDFEVDFLEVFRINGSKKRRASHQEIGIGPLYRYKNPRIVRVGEAQRFVYVLPKFVLGDNERLKLSLRELHGNRRVELFK